MQASASLSTSFRLCGRVAMWSKSVRNISRINSVVHKRWAHVVQGAAGQSYIKNPGSEPLMYDTLGEVLSQTVNKYPDRIAVRSVHENITLTYAELLKQADSLGCALRAQGLQKGDTVGIWSHNNAAWFVAVIATIRAGLIPVLVNPAYEKRELSFCIKKTDMKSLLVADKLPNKNYYDALAQMIPELEHNKPGAWQSKEFPSLQSIVTMGKEKLPGAMLYDSLVTGTGSQISQYGSEIKYNDGCIIHFTSGTTGNPKAALDSHLGVVNNTYFIGKRNTCHEGHHNICIQVPLFHALGSVVVVMTGMRFGCSFVLPGPTYNVDTNIKAAIGEKCTFIVGTPTMFVDILSKIKTMGDVPSKLRVALTAGAPCSPQLIREMQNYLKTESVMCIYGMTENTASVFQSIPGDSIDVVAETVGYIQDHLETKVVDENDNIVPFGSPGELLVRGYSNMISYYNDPEKTKETISEDGWLRTGDKFALSEDGYGRIVGRIKDIIVRGGENIAPKEIEDILITHPDIVDCQVVGVPDERLGEELCAVLRVRDGTSVNLDQVRSHCEGHIARFKIPRLIKTIEEFPKTASGKVQKYRIKEMIEAGQL